VAALTLGTPLLHVLTHWSHRCFAADYARETHALMLREQR
jgi:hypothetical protein